MPQNLSEMPQNLSDAERQARNCNTAMKTLSSMPPSLCEAQKQARNCGLDIPKLEALLAEIEPLSDKYKEIFYRAATGLYSADDLAEMFNHSQKNLNADFNKNLGANLKLHLDLDDSERVGITSLRRILFKKGYCVINDILTSRYVENSELERSASDKISTESDH
ncbi:MAG: hypothetical protein GPI96_06210 [Microcystis aeruginosa BS13-02]|nr:hypothetical protein [Microcystis aeruginosa BS13-02]